MKDIYIIRYQNPALSYLPKIGGLLHDVFKNYHNNLIKYCDIDNFIAELKAEQVLILKRNPRLKPIEIHKNCWTESIIIDTPVKNSEPEELFSIEPVSGYLYELSKDDFYGENR